MKEQRHGALRLSFADGESWELGARTRVVGILNVTPDSFSDGGHHLDPETALAAAHRMVEQGVDIIDVGGESTRPGARPVDTGDERQRVVPVIEAIKGKLPVRVSVDTMKAAVARAALQAGADMINDVSALSDPAMLPLAVDSGAPIALMHMRGTPRDMQTDTRYDDLLASITTFLREIAVRVSAAGIADDKIVLDPGIGFGKSPQGSLEILRELSTLRTLERPILVGASRKSFIGAALDLPVTERLEASLAVAALAAWNGAHLLRVHDVGETVRVTRMVDAIRRS